MDNHVNQDREHLKILSICHYVFAGLCMLPFLYGLIYMFMGLFAGAMLATAPASHDAPPAFLFGGIFVLIGLVISGISLMIGIAAIISGRKMSKLNGRMFSLIFAGAICMFVPIGTILGIFTLIVLSRDSVKSLFDGAGAPQTFGANPPNWR